MQLPNWLARLNFALGLKTDANGWNLTSDLEGELRKDEVLLPAHVTGTVAQRNKEDQGINLENLRLRLGQDDVNVNGMSSILPSTR